MPVNKPNQESLVAHPNLVVAGVTEFKVHVPPVVEKDKPEDQEPNAESEK